MQLEKNKRAPRITSFLSSAFFILLTMVLITGSTYLLYNYKTQQIQILSSSTPPALDYPVAQQTFDKNYKFLLGSVQCNIRMAELRKSIILNNKQSTSAPGISFLVIHVKYTTSSDRPTVISLSDTLSLNAGDVSKKIYPIITSDPLSLVSDAVIYTPVVFAVQDTARDFTLIIEKEKNTYEYMNLALK